MPTLTAGQTATLTMGAFDSITITLTGTTGKGSIALTSLASSIRSDIPVSVLQSKTYGPYGAPMTTVVTCADSSIVYLLNVGAAGSGVLWADRPSAASNTGQVITVTDVGSRSRWTSDGTYWRPQNGRVLLYSRAVQGDPTTTSITSLTGNSTSQSFTLPVEMLIPAGVMNYPSAVLRLNAMFRRVGVAGATGNVLISVSTTANGAAASTLIAVQSTMTATEGGQVSINGQARVDATNNLVLGQRMLDNQSITTTGMYTVAGVIPSAALYVTLVLHSSWTADVCHLLSYSASLEG